MVLRLDLVPTFLPAGLFDPAIVSPSTIRENQCSKVAEGVIALASVRACSPTHLSVAVLDVIGGNPTGSNQRLAGIKLPACVILRCY
jgi:hypothetical protein